VVGVVIVGAVTLAVVLNRQDADLRSRLEAATAAPDPENPPPGIWVAMLDRNGTVSLSSNAPSGVPLSEQVREARGGESPVVEEVGAGGTEYLTRTEAHGGTVVQTGVDFGPRDAERGRLLLGLGIAGAVAAAAAALFGMWQSRRALAPLEEAMDRQRRFVADASHELRTPLTRLTLRAQLLERGSRDARSPADLHDEAAMLVREAEQMAGIVEDLLLSAQLESSPSLGELVDLAELAGRVVDAEQPRAAAKAVTLRMEVSPSPPVRGVPVALTRAVNALVDNALGHAPDGGHVTVAVEPGDDGSVLLSVTDDGPGIDPADRDRLFERFARGQGGHGRFGLGLALAREVVDTHGGRVAVDPLYDVGARLVVSLPAAGPDQHRP
jgi:signal transduction histidine kinase